MECLICYSRINATKSQSRSLRIPDTTKLFGTTAELSKQISVIFTVRKLLELPSSVCERFLQDVGNPSDWGISYCSKCAAQIREAQMISGELNRIQNKLKEVTAKVQSVILESIRQLGTKRDPAKNWRPSDEIRFQFSKRCSKPTVKNKARNLGDVPPEPEHSVDDYDDFIPSSDDIDNIKFEEIDIDKFDAVNSPLSPDLSHNDDSDEEYIPAASKNRQKHTNRSRPKGKGTFIDFVDKITGTDKTGVKDAESSEPTNAFLDKRAAQTAKEQLLLLQQIGNINTEDSDSSVMNADETINECTQITCDLKFKTSFERDIHKKSVHQEIENPFSCELCDNSFPSKPELEDHLKSHLSNTCPKCGFRASSEIRLNAHIQRVHFGETNPFSCVTCDRKFGRLPKLEAHLKNFHNIVLQESIRDKNRMELYNEGTEGSEPVVKKAKPPAPVKRKFRIKCTEANCKLTFPCEVTRDFHIQKLHLGVRTPYKCHLCPREFTRNGTLQFHLRDHEIKSRLPPSEPTTFMCEECGKILKNRQSLKAHIDKVHSDQPKPYMCEICSKTFREVRYLEEHQVRFHAEELKLTVQKCEECGANFGNRKRLNEHVTIVHRKQYDFQCPLCPVGFANKYQLDKHMLLHKEKQHKCPQCSKAFHYKFYLKNHMRVHTGEKPWTCITCSKSFADKSTYNRHIEGHEGKIYKCSICDKEFPIRHSLVVHMKKHAGSNTNFKFKIPTKSHRKRNNKICDTSSPKNHDEPPPTLFEENAVSVSQSHRVDDVQSNDFRQMPQIFNMSYDSNSTSHNFQYSNNSIQ